MCSEICRIADFGFGIADLRQIIIFKQSAIDNPQSEIAIQKKMSHSKI